MTATRIPLILACLAILVFLPGLTGGFFFDDYQNVVNNDALVLPDYSLPSLLDAAFSADPGPLGRPVAMVSFALERTALDGFAWHFLLTNILIHALNAVLVFILLRELFTARSATFARPEDAVRLAAFGAALWAVHPQHVLTVLYVVQRMTELAATFVLLGLLAYIAARRRAAAGHGTAAVALLAVTGLTAVLGLLSKENAVVLPLLVVMVEAVVFRFAGPRYVRTGFTALVVGGGVLAMAALTWKWNWIEGGYAYRPFTLGERLWTETRVLADYARYTLLPPPGGIGFYHDSYRLSQGPLTPPSTLLALLLLGAMTAGATLAWRRYPLVAFGLGWFLAGHLLESSVIALDLKYVHRNYLPSLGLSIVAALALGELARRLAEAFRPVLVMVVPTALLAVLTLSYAWTWSDPLTHAIAEARLTPHSQRAIYELGRTYHRLYEFGGYPRHLALARTELKRSVPLGPEPFLPLTALIITDESNGAGADPAVVGELQEILATQDLNRRRLASISLVQDCQARGACPVRVDLVLKLTEAAMDNPGLAEGFRIDVLKSLAIYYVNVLGDTRAAIGLLEDLVRAHPEEDELLLTLAEALVVAGDDAGAAIIRRGIERSDGWWTRLRHREFERRVSALDLHLAGT